MDTAQDSTVLSLGNAINSETRLTILRQLFDKSLTVSEIAKLNFLSVSSATFHTSLLEQAGLIDIVYVPSKKGNVRVCHNNLANIDIFFEKKLPSHTSNIVTYSVPVGHYIDAELNFISGFATNTDRILFDDGNFFCPLRTEAQIIWATSGNITYAFTNAFAKNKKVAELSVLLEICSETAHYHNNWKSDITFYINGTELATYTSPGDLGGRRGTLNPDWWPENATQYGQLKKLTVNDNGVYIDGLLVNRSVTLSQLDITAGNKLTFTLGNKPDAEYVGGFNIFGQGFGDYPQDIQLLVLFKD